MCVFFVWIAAARYRQSPGVWIHSTAISNLLHNALTSAFVVFICGTGARSGESFYMVQDVRPELKNVFYVDAEMTVHEDGTFTLKKP